MVSRVAGFTWMKPRSVSLTPTASSPIASVFTARPAAINTLSAVIVSCFPPTSTVMLTSAAFTSAFTTFTPASTLMPRFLYDLAITSEHSASSIGRMRGNASISVTSEPNALKMSANSQPTAPAPTIASRFGAVSRKSASSEVITVVPLTARPTGGIPLVREPVASTMPFLAVSTSSPTFTVVAEARTPVPLMTVTLFFFIRNSAPFEFCSATFRDRFIATP